MLKLFDVFTIKKRQFIVKEKDMLEVLKMFQTALADGYRTGGLSVGDCGCAKETDLWYIHTSLTDNQWKGLLNGCKNNNYQLVIKNSPNVMYFTKVKES